jgi:hypothetical protein
MVRGKRRIKGRGPEQPEEPGQIIVEYVEQLRFWILQAQAQAGQEFDPPPDARDRNRLIVWWAQAWRKARAWARIPRLPVPPREFAEAVAQVAARETAELIAMINGLTGHDSRRPISINSGRKSRGRAKAGL